MGSALVTYKGQFCRHPDSCFINAFKKAFAALTHGLCIEVAIDIFKFLFELLKKRNLKSALKHLFMPRLQKLRIPMFLFVNTLTLKGSYCILRYLRGKEDKLNPLAAGAICALLSMPFLKKDHWYLMLSLIATRITDSVHKILCARGWLNPDNTQLHYVLLFAFGNFINAYGFFMEADIIEKDVENLYRRMADLDYKQMMWLRSTQMYTRKILKESGAKFFNTKLDARIDALKNDPKGINGF